MPLSVLQTPKQPSFIHTEYDSDGCAASFSTTLLRPRRALLPWLRTGASNHFL